MFCVFTKRKNVSVELGLFSRQGEDYLPDPDEA